jgi:hypothetical protein
MQYLCYLILKSAARPVNFRAMMAEYSPTCPVDLLIVLASNTAKKEEGEPSSSVSSMVTFTKIDWRRGQMQRAS